jgi:hypothetical protein
MRLICIPAIKSHALYVGYSLKLLNKRFPEADFMIVTPDRESFRGLESSNIFIRDDFEFWDLSPDDVQRKLAASKKNMSKWYYQQLLKYSIISKAEKYTEVLIVDADTIILSDCIEDVRAINTTSLEYNESYFEIIQRYFPDHTRLSKSAIVNFMWFDTALFGEMLNAISKNGEGLWFDTILMELNKVTSPFAFSEYETYGNYKYNNFDTSFRHLRIFRRADLFLSFYSFDKIIMVADMFKLDLISFEHSHDKSTFKKTIVLIMVIFIELTLALKRLNPFKRS